MDAAVRRYVWVEDRRETRLPFSKFVMASSMMVIGVPPEQAFGLAGEIEGRLLALDIDEVGVERLVEMTSAVLDQQASAHLARRYLAWVEARRRKLPIVVLLGGMSGTGKSTVAAGVAGRLRLAPVLSSDSIREVMRTVLPADAAPQLRSSSFEAHLDAPGVGVVKAFREQAELVATGVRGMLRRSLREGTDLLVEGVHIVPGMFADDLSEYAGRAVFCRAVLTVADPGTHRAHFLTRLERAPHRGPQRYLDHFAEIRRIGEHIAEEAERAGVACLEMRRLDDVIQTLVGMVVDEVIAAGAP